MSTTGRECVKLDLCSCGKHGFRKESEATRYVVGRRRLTDSVEHVKCPVGDCFHTFNPAVRNRASYVTFLSETAGQPQRPRGGDPEDAGSSSPGSRATACTKVGYGSERVATLALKGAREAGRDEKRAYACPACSRWHLSSAEEFFPFDSIVYEELLAFAQAGEAFTLSVGRYPSGLVANVTLTGSRVGVVRIHAQHLAPLRFVLDSLKAGTDDAAPDTNS